VRSAHVRQPSRHVTEDTAASQTVQSHARQQNLHSNSLTTAHSTTTIHKARPDPAALTVLRRRSPSPPPPPSYPLVLRLSTKSPVHRAPSLERTSHRPKRHECSGGETVGRLDVVEELFAHHAHELRLRERLSVAVGVNVTDQTTDDAIRDRLRDARQKLA